MTGGGADQTARDAADTAQGAAEQAQAEIDTHEATPHNTDTTARDAAAAAQSEIDAHEATPHNTDTTARTAASAAQARADDAFALADEKVDASGAAAAAREVTADWAEDANPDPIPAPKLRSTSSNSHEDIVNVLDGRLARLARRDAAGLVTEGGIYRFRTFARPSPPIGGSISGMSDGLAAPPFPPSLASDPTLFLGIWLAGDPDVVEISGGGAQFGNKRSLTLEGWQGGRHPWRLRWFRPPGKDPLEGHDFFSVTITGPRLVTESDLADACRRSRCAPHAAGRRHGRRAGRAV